MTAVLPTLNQTPKQTPKQGPADIAAMCKALGDPTRLRIFQSLCSCCCPVAVDAAGDAREIDGLTVGEVCCNVMGLARITSTVSFHLKELKNAGLITMEKRGKNVVCGPSREALETLRRFFESIDQPATSGC